MIGKLLTKARELLKPSAPDGARSDRKEPPVPKQPNGPIPAAQRTISPAAPENILLYEEGDFRFSMPLEKEEREVLEEARKRYAEMKERFGEGANAWEKNQLAHFKAKQYWSLQIFYKDRAQFHYKRRNEDPESLKKAIYYCQKQIQYAPMAIRAHRMDPLTKELPHHYGYRQLAIIRDKEGQYDEAIRLCEEALNQGWKGDWEARIERYKKKRSGT
ncbi:hypothetical protein C8P63_11575 [Melghirimyces profundicolus]|uniref:Tetratricopeptide repeat protein n=1 Tax=Melghirimyces profundicolus TaxID=1242148 RepID=A0A2T6BRS3_9BACL|nr:hypothetical protein [Melghirimyces profundicolus]PTX58677.1 hypothetical protein C8P63_11575 [Melghirimyces profundicolus]